MGGAVPVRDLTLALPLLAIVSLFKKGTQLMEKLVKKLAAIALIGMTLSGGFGCAYGGLATAPDGSMYVARNDLLLFGLLRKIYSCRPGPAGLVCTEVPTIP
jgi:hypothetical protein